MTITRREFVKGGIVAFTFGFAAPGFLCNLARAQGAAARNLVVLYLGGGNDSLSTLIPYTDTNYYARRPTLAVPAASVLQIGTDSSGRALGLHPRLTGLRDMYNQGAVALIQRCGYANSSRSHFTGGDIWASADPTLSQSDGWLGRYLDSLPQPIDPLTVWNATSETPRALFCQCTSIPSIANVQAYAFGSTNGGADAQYEREAATRIVSHVPVGYPHVAFVTEGAQAALATIDRVQSVTTYTPSGTYPNNGFGQALRSIAGAMVKGLGTRIFWLAAGGFDTHANQGVNNNGAYTTLMATLNDGLLAFHTDLRNQGLLDSTLIVQFSEFGRRIPENGSQGTDHGAASLMMAIGGNVRGGIHGTAPLLVPDPQNPTLENNGNDVHFETDFRSVYARVIDGWLGADSVSLLGGDFRAGAPAFL